MLTRRNLMVIGGGAALGGAYAFWPRGGTPDRLPGLAGAAQAQGGVEIPDIAIGDPDAPVTVIEYASYTCPHCAAFHRDTFKPFREKYVDTGRVRFVYREVFFDRYGLWASMVARCAPEDRYFGIADLIYASQSDWARQSDGAAVAESLKRIGAQAGLSRDELDACLSDGETAQGLVSWYEENARRDGVQSTPSFVIGGEVHAGNMTLEKLSSLVEDAGA